MKSFPSFYFIRVRNFGDRITPFLIEQFTDRLPVHGAASSEHLVACGSILTSANEHSKVWGTGFVSGEANVPRLSEGSVNALRGRLSLDKLKKCYDWIGNIPLGDPGSLVPTVIDPSRRSEYKFGVVPHYADKSHEFLERCRRKGALIIDPQRDLIDVVKDITKCRFILSSSLHGLIVSDAYGIPNKWIQLSDNVFGGGFKFHDYYSTRRVDDSNPMRVGPDSRPLKMLRRCKCTTPKYNVDLLRGAFPDNLPGVSTTEGITDTSTYKKQDALPIPVFIPMKGEKRSLDLLFESLDNLGVNFQAVIHLASGENTSIDEWLAGLAAQDRPLKPVVSSAVSATERNCLMGTIEQHFSTYSEPTHYLVADIHTRVKQKSRHLTDFMFYLLNRYWAIDGVSLSHIPETSIAIDGGDDPIGPYKDSAPKAELTKRLHRGPVVADIVIGTKPEPGLCLYRPGFWSTQTDNKASIRYYEEAG
jgi:pyruvyltransferase